MRAADLCWSKASGVFLFLSCFRQFHNLTVLQLLEVIFRWHRIFRVLSLTAAESWRSLHHGGGGVPIEADSLQKELWKRQKRWEWWGDARSCKLCHSMSWFVFSFGAEWGDKSRQAKNGAFRDWYSFIWGFCVVPVHFYPWIPFFYCSAIPVLISSSTLFFPGYVFLFHFLFLLHFHYVIPFWPFCFFLSSLLCGMGRILPQLHCFVVSFPTALSSCFLGEVIEDSVFVHLMYLAWWSFLLLL